MQEQIEGKLEAVLFVSGRKVKISKLAELLGVNIELLETTAKRLNERYRTRNAGIRIVKRGESLQMVSSPEYHEFLSEVFKTKNRELKMNDSALETLAVVAYMQPITRDEIDRIRGVMSVRPLLKLLKLGLVEIVGRKNTPGKPFLYGTTRKFLSLVGIESLKELPDIESVRKSLKGEGGGEK